MGVSHLAQYAKQANGAASAPTGGSPNSTQVRGLNSPPATSNETRHVPQMPEVNRFGNKSAHPGNMASEPPKNGGRAGNKSGRPNVGTQKDAKHPISGAEMY